MTLFKKISLISSYSSFPNSNDFISLYIIFYSCNIFGAYPYNFSRFIYSISRLLLGFSMLSILLFSIIVFPTQMLSYKYMFREIFSSYSRRKYHSLLLIIIFTITKIVYDFTCILNISFIITLNFSILGKGNYTLTLI